MLTRLRLRRAADAGRRATATHRTRVLS